MAGDMSGHHDFGSADAGDHHRAHTHEFSYSSSSKAGPRRSPPLRISRNKLTTAEPRNLSTSINQHDDIDHDYGTSDNYTYGSGCQDPYTGYNGTRLSEFIHDRDIDQRLAFLKLDRPRGLDVDPGTNDKDIPRSYAEVVKTSPISTKSTYQAAPARPKSPKKTTRRPAKLPAQQVPASGIEWPSQTLSQSVGQSVKSLKSRKSAGHNQAGESGARKTPSQPVRCATLDDLRTAYRKQSATNDIRPATSGNHIAAQNIYHTSRSIVTTNAAAEESTSFLDNTKGIGDWAGSGPCYHGPSLSTDIPRIVSTTSPQYQKLLCLEGIVQCATGKTGSSASNAAPFPKSQAGQKAGAGKGRKRNAGKRTPQKGNDGEDDDDGSDGNSNDLKGPKHNPDPSVPQKWYACPFHKHDPSYFSTNGVTRMRYKTCGAGKWTDIPRLKEHLHRVHSDPHTFDRSKGILPDVQEQLRGRPKRGMSNEQRWYTIWDLLFPGEDHPMSPYSDLQDVENFHEFLAQRMHGHFSAHLSTSLDGMGLTQELKRLLIDIAVEQEKVSRHELLDMFQKKDSPSPGPVSEEGESPDPAITLPTARHASSEPEQPSKTLYSQPETSNMSSPGYPAPIDYRQQLSQLFDPQPSIFAQPTTPVFSNERLRSSTPAQFSSSSRSGDSAYHSGSGGYPSGVSDDGLCVNPKFLHLHSPTPNIPHPRRNTAPSRNMNAEVSSSYAQEPKAPARRPVHSSLLSPTGNLDNSMYGAVCNDDAPGSPEYMY